MQTCRLYLAVEAVNKTNEKHTDDKYNMNRRKAVTENKENMTTGI